MSTIFDMIHDLSFPTPCPGCNKKVLEKGSTFCTICLINLPLTDTFEQKNMNKVIDNFRGRIPIEHGAAVLYFQNHGIVQEMLHNFKYRKKKNIGTIIGKMAGEKMMQCGNYPKVDLIVPIPLFWRKKRARGYNQSEVFARGMSETSYIPVNNVLSKLFDSESQTSKSRMQREANVAFHFAVNEHKAIKGKHIVLVDDVITTGSTMASAGKMLLKNGASKISIVTMAVALY